MVSRRKFVASLSMLGAAALAAEALIIEPRRVLVSRHTLSAAGSSSDCVVRFVQLSDMHLKRVGWHERRIARIVNMLKPDFIVFTGDSANSPRNLGEFAHFLDLLDRHIPKYAIPGNWEHWSGIDFERWSEVYTERNGRYLVNATAECSFNGARYQITGVDDLVTGAPDIDEALKNVQPAGNHLLLSHCPAYRDRIMKSARDEESHSGQFTIQFMLSGHTHGGQIALFGYAPYLPPGCGRYSSGWYTEGTPKLFVSRGIGTSIIPARFMAPPEVAFFEWSLVK